MILKYQKDKKGPQPLLQCEPHDVIFLDDNDMNVVAARSIGMHAVRVKGIAEAKRALVAAGVFENWLWGRYSAG